MTTLRAPSIPWPLLAVLAAGLTLTACKKTAESGPPDGEHGEIGEHPGDNGGDAGPDDEAAPEVLTVDVFEEIVDKHKGDVSDCYAAAKEAKADLAGKLMLDFTIDGSSGKVREVKVDPGSTLKDDGLNTCVSDKAKGWEFPKTRDGEDMTLPYAFNLS